MFKMHIYPAICVSMWVALHRAYSFRNSTSVNWIEYRVQHTKKRLQTTTIEKKINQIFMLPSIQRLKFNQNPSTLFFSFFKYEILNLINHKVIMNIDRTPREYISNLTNEQNRKVWKKRWDEIFCACRVLYQSFSICLHFILKNSIEFVMEFVFFLSLPFTTEKR